MISIERLAEAFVEVADTLVDEFDLVDFLHSLADHAAIVSGASSVGLMLTDHDGSLRFMAASNEGAKHLELLELQYDEGPSVDCHRLGAPVILTDLSGAEHRWPEFVPRAVALGVRSVHAFPMQLRDRVIGALNIFGEQPLPLDAGDIKIVQAMADVATISILQERAITNAEILAEQLQGAMRSRIVIEQAKGVISRQHGVSVEEAFVAIRAHARRNHLRLSDLAADIVNGAEQTPPDDDPA